MTRSCCSGSRPQQVYADSSGDRWTLCVHVCPLRTTRAVASSMLRGLTRPWPCPRTKDVFKCSAHQMHRSRSIPPKVLKPCQDHKRREKIYTMKKLESREYQPSSCDSLIPAPSLAVCRRGSSQNPLQRLLVPSMIVLRTSDVS
jgi:hypothetical protein